MAQRAKYKYRGRTYTRASKRPGKRTVTVRAHCRSARRLWQSAKSKAEEWGF